MAYRLKKQNIEGFVIGYPRQMNNEPSEAVRYINPFIKYVNLFFHMNAVATFVTI